MRKKEILASLDIIQKQYCHGCFLYKHFKAEKGRRFAHRFCITQCTVGESLQQYGKHLSQRA